MVSAEAKRAGIILIALTVLVLALPVLAVLALRNAPHPPSPQLVGLSAVYVCDRLYAVSMHMDDKTSHVFGSGDSRLVPKDLQDASRELIAGEKGVAIINVKDKELCGTKTAR